MSPVGPIWACLGPNPNPKPKLAKPDEAEDDGVGAKGAFGPPVNCCTMARKLVVSVLRRVVGVRREALDRRRTGFATRPSGLRWLWVVEADADADELELSMLDGSGGGLEAVTPATVVTAVASDMEEGMPPWKSCCCW